MRACAFLTLDDPEGYVIDDDLVVPPLAELGWRVELVPWRRPGVDWRRFDWVVIRSTWDYYEDPRAFLTVLETIESAGVPLRNTLDLVRWNLEKTYLRDLAERGVAIVPSRWLDGVCSDDLDSLFSSLGTDEIVIKPVVGANATATFRLDRTTVGDRVAEVEAALGGRPCLAQPLVRSVIDEGEVSVMVFDGVISHAVLKTPKTGDFRVQEEHGGRIQVFEPDADLRAAVTKTLAALPRTPLYARVDLVRAPVGRGSWWLMELELIEPSLYLRCDPRAVERFARVLDRCVTHHA